MEVTRQKSVVKKFKSKTFRHDQNNSMGRRERIGETPWREAREGKNFQSRRSVVGYNAEASGVGAK